MYSGTEFCSHGLTVTNNPCIFEVEAEVVFCDTSMSAVSKIRLPSWTLDVVEPNGITALAKLGSTVCRDSRGITKGSAHHVSIINVPKVITHGAPLIVDENFNTTIGFIAIDKPDTKQFNVLIICRIRTKKGNMGWMWNLYVRMYALVHWYQEPCFLGLKTPVWTWLPYYWGICYTYVGVWHNFNIQYTYVSLPCSNQCNYIPQLH